MDSITSNDFLNSVLEAEAWKELSQRESLSMSLLEKYADKMDWEEVSGNQNVLWTMDGISKFAKSIEWEEFSRCCPDSLISETSLQKFDDKWDWKNLSNRDRVYNDWNLLEKFADKLNWGEVITNWNIEKPMEFFVRFQKYIPMSKLQESRLWDSMVEACAKRLYQDAIGINII